MLVDACAAVLPTASIPGRLPNDDADCIDLGGDRLEPTPVCRPPGLEHRGRRGGARRGHRVCGHGVRPWSAGPLLDHDCAERAATVKTTMTASGFRAATHRAIVEQRPTRRAEHPLHPPPRRRTRSDEAAVRRDRSDLSEIARNTSRSRSRRVSRSHSACGTAPSLRLLEQTMGTAADCGRAGRPARWSGVDSNKS